MTVFGDCIVRGSNTKVHVFDTSFNVNRVDLFFRRLSFTAILMKAANNEMSQFKREKVEKSKQTTRELSELKLAAAFKETAEDPELNYIFELVLSIEGYVFDKQMWCVSEALEQVLDSILRYKDQKDRGVAGFYSRRTGALPLGTPQNTRIEYQAELSRRIIKSVTC